MRHQCRDCLTVSERPEYCQTCADSRDRHEQISDAIETALVAGVGVIFLLLVVALS